MAKGQKRFGEKLKGLLFGRGERDEQEAQTEQEEPAEEEAAADQPEEKTEEACPVIPEEEEKKDWIITVNPGELTELWVRWRPEEPLCSLAIGGEGPEFPLKDQDMRKEKLRLAMLLERDARKRILTITDIETEIGVSKALADALVQAQRTQDGPEAEDPELPLTEEPEEKQVPPKLKLDADCRIYLSEKKLAAWIFVFPPCGDGADVTYEMISERLHEEHITTGIDTDAVSHLVQERSYFQLIPIAVGKAPVEGENGRIEDHFYREIPAAVRIDENGVADYRDTHYIQAVEEKQAICEIIPPREGEPGLCVDGVVLQPAHVTAAKVPKGRNTEISEDGSQLIAAKGGHVEFSRDCFHVKSVLDIEGNVDYSTGNIDFNGDVHVHGDIRENFHVRATGGVSVDGLVEAAIVDAGGDIIIASGVQGNFKAVLKSKGSIRAKFLENCVAYARKGIMADSIVACQVYSDDFIQTVSGRGAIIGGEVAASYLVKARLIGSQAGRKTRVRLGILPCVEEELRENISSLDDIRAEMMQLDARLDILAVSEGLEEGSPELNKAQLQKSALSLREMQLLKERRKLDLTEPDLTKCRMEAGVLYPITRVEIGPYILDMEQVKNNCKIKYDPQECAVVVV